eukprot:gene22494-29621_t
MEQLNALTEAGDGDALPADIPIDKLDNITVTATAVAEAALTAAEMADEDDLKSVSAVLKEACSGLRARRRAMKWTEGSQGAVLKELNSTLRQSHSKVQSRVVGILKDISDAKEWQAAHPILAARHHILAALGTKKKKLQRHLRAIAAPHRILAALAARLRHSTVSLQHLLRDLRTPPYPLQHSRAIVAPPAYPAALACLITLPMAIMFAAICKVPQKKTPGQTPALSTEEDPGPVTDPVVTVSVYLSPQHPMLATPRCTLQLSWSTEEDPGPVTGPVVTVTKDGSLLQKEDNKAEQGDVVDLQEIPSSKLEARGHGHGGLGHGVGEGRGKGGGGLGHGVQEGRGKGGGGLGRGVGEGRVTGDGSLGHGDAGAIVARHVVEEVDEQCMRHRSGSSEEVAAVVPRARRCLHSECHVDRQVEKEV